MTLISQSLLESVNRKYCGLKNVNTVTEPEFSTLGTNILPDFGSAFGEIKHPLSSCWSTMNECFYPSSLFLLISAKETFFHDLQNRCQNTDKWGKNTRAYQNGWVQGTLPLPIYSHNFPLNRNSVDVVGKVWEKEVVYFALI